MTPPRHPAGGVSWGKPFLGDDGAMPRLLFTISILVLSSLSHLCHADEPLVHQSVFRAGEGGYHTYRIPSLIVTPRGRSWRFARGGRKGPATRGTSTCSSGEASTAARPGSRRRWCGTTARTPAAIPARSSNPESGTLWLLLTHNLGSDTEPAIIDGKSKGSRTVWVSKSTRRRRHLDQARRDHRRRQAAGLDLVRHGARASASRRRAAAWSSPATTKSGDQKARSRTSSIATTRARPGSWAASSARIATSRRSPSNGRRRCSSTCGATGQQAAASSPTARTAA